MKFCFEKKSRRVYIRVSKLKKTPKIFFSLIFSLVPFFSLLELPHFRALSTTDRIGSGEAPPTLSDHQLLRSRPELVPNGVAAPSPVARISSFVPRICQVLPRCAQGDHCAQGAPSAPGAREAHPRRATSRPTQASWGPTQASDGQHPWQPGPPLSCATHRKTHTASGHLLRCSRVRTARTNFWKSILMTVAPDTSCQRF